MRNHFVAVPFSMKTLNQSGCCYCDAKHQSSWSRTPAVTSGYPAVVLSVRGKFLCVDYFPSLWKNYESGFLGLEDIK